MKTRKLISIAICLISIMSCSKKTITPLDISGTWKFQTDSLDVGISEAWYNVELQDEITLPGSMNTNGKGNSPSIKTKWTGQIVDSSFFKSDKYAKYRNSDNFKIPFWLQPNSHYIGAAWYQKDIEIGSDWKEKNITLLLERCHWETQLWIDGKKVGLKNSLSTPHVFNLTSFLSPGKHTLTLRVDNSIKELDPGKNAHSISDHTQSNWNGIAGAMELVTTPLIYIKDVKIFPNISEKKATVKILIDNTLDLEKDVEIQLSAESFNTEISHIVFSNATNHTVSNGITELSLTMNMGEDVLLWSEFAPNLYRLNISLKSDGDNHIKTVNFGMREFTVKGTRFQINNHPIFLRGTLESSIFPITGYPSTSVEEWTRIFKICKAHGMNHVRFHSHCPPKAAFVAADKEGIYLQVEAGSWANSGSSLGDGKPIDKWLYQEADRILEAYGNHPSFCMMAYGNEPAGQNQANYLKDFVSHLKNKDNRRVYTGGAGWPFLTEYDFYNHAGPRIQGWGQGLNSIINKEAPKTNYDFEEIVAEIEMPYVSHEIGQWCAYPNFKEIKKYTGVMKAKNFEIFQETLEENSLGYLADSLLLASGKLQALCYKADIEAALRTPGFAGFQLLDLHDFPGQGSALVGVLDAFWEEKGYITAEEYSQFCNQTVPLARMEKRVFKNNEPFNAEIEIAHFGEYPLKSPEIKWIITDIEGEEFKKGMLSVENVAIDNCQKIGTLKLDLSAIKEPKQLHLNISINQFSNGWDFWVYPVQPVYQNKEIYSTSILDKKAIQILNNGGKVLWSLKKGMLNPKFGGDIKVGFSSIFWNTAWTGGQPPHTLGILCNPKHPAFKEFPTEYHSNWQWWDGMSHGQAIIMDELSVPIKPIVRIVDDWFENRSLGLIFEAKVGKGKMIVSGADLLTNVENRLEAQQLLYSLTQYMESQKFHPKKEISLKELKQLKHQNSENR